MPSTVFSIRPTASLLRFLAARTTRTDRGARPPWTRAAVLNLGVERYELILGSLSLPEPPRRILSTILEGLRPFPIPANRITSLPSLLHLALDPLASDPLVGRYLDAVDQLELVELVGLAERLEAEERHSIGS
jgi:hypothetical protein